MKASEVIAKLRKLVDQHGDLPVYVEDGMDPSNAEEVSHICLDGIYLKRDDRDSEPMFYIGA